MISNSLRHSQLIDVIEGDRTYTPVLYVYNKIDSLLIEELDILDRLDNVVPSKSLVVEHACCLPLMSALAPVYSLIATRSLVLFHS